MKTNEEMTESLLQRRDNYIKEKAKRSMRLRLIPKIGVPLCAMAAVVTVLSFNRDIFKANSPGGVDINLISGGASLPGISEDYYTQEDTDSSLRKEAEIIPESSSGFSAKELLGFTPEELEAAGIYSGEDIQVPEKIVCKNIIYTLTDYEITSEGLTGYRIDIMFIPFGSAAIYSTNTQGEGETKSSRVTVFNIGSNQWSAAILINGQIYIYEKEKSAKFYIGDVVYKASEFIPDRKIFGSFALYSSYEDYDVYSGYLLGKSQWIIYDKIEDKTWLCADAYSRDAEQLQINTDYCGSIIDLGEIVMDYVNALDRAELTENYYDVSYTGKFDEYWCESFKYNGSEYGFAGYSDGSDELYQWVDLSIGGRRFTLFKVNRSTDTLAIIQQGSITYFNRISPAVYYSTDIEPLSLEELETAVKIYTTDPISAEDIKYDRYCYYDGSFNIQFYYKNDNGAEFAFIVSTVDESPDNITALKLMNINTGDYLDLTYPYQYNYMGDFLVKGSVDAEREWLMSSKFIADAE